MNALALDKIAQWKFDGFLSPFPLLDAEELRTCLAGVQTFRDVAGFAYQCGLKQTLQGDGIKHHPDMKWRSMPHLLMPWAANLARDPRILDHVDDLIGPDILIFTSTFFLKEPHSPTQGRGYRVGRSH
jgi:non-haem Fe2+, alpha-ketoglutarate-dependent halogenase